MRLKYYLTKFRVQWWKAFYSSNYIDQIILWKTIRNSITKGFKDEKMENLSRESGERGARL